MQIIFGLISCVLGYLLVTPKDFNGWLADELRFEYIKILVLSASMSAASIVNGHNQKMFVRSKSDFTVSLIFSSLLGVIISIIILYLVKYQFVGRRVVFWTVLFYFILSFLNCYIASLFGNRKVSILGSGACKFERVMTEVGGDRLKRIYEVRDMDFVENDFESLRAAISDDRTCYICLSNENGFSRFTHSEIDVLLRSGKVSSVEVAIEKELAIILLDNVKGLNWWQVFTPARSGVYPCVKRWMDITAAVIICLVAFPVVIIAGILIKLSDQGPIIYKQVRSGQFGVPFEIYKLRTMGIDSEKNGAQWASSSDSRVTFVGKILRRTRVDELPQIWNILVGDMSLVGPRPERPEFYKIITHEIPEFAIRLSCKPGLTGWAQVNYPYGASVHDSKMKMLFDMYYIKNASLLLDFRIVSRTLSAMVRGAR
jgi:lipopolysaccharide/colanic/teichoic acid biosynthesis glycosyltransferase